MILHRYQVLDIACSLFYNIDVRNKGIGNGIRYAVISSESIQTMPWMYMEHH